MNSGRGMIDDSRLYCDTQDSPQVYVYFTLFYSYKNLRYYAVATLLNPALAAARCDPS